MHAHRYNARVQELSCHFFSEFLDPQSKQHELCVKAVREAPGAKSHGIARGFRSVVSDALEVHRDSQTIKAFASLAMERYESSVVAVATEPTDAAESATETANAAKDGAAKAAPDDSDSYSDQYDSGDGEGAKEQVSPASRSHTLSASGSVANQLSYITIR